MDELSRINGLFHEYSNADITVATRSTEAFAIEVFDVLTTDNQHYFLKILKSQHSEAIAREAAMQRHLRAAGIGSPEYMEIAPGNYVGEHEDERFLLSTFIPGAAPHSVSPQLIQSFGTTLAKLHDCLGDTPIPDNGMQWLNPTRVATDIISYHGPA